MASELDEIWALYQDDGGESLHAAEEALETLGREPAEREAIAALFRALHTFKGNSRILGLANIERVAHVAEDVIGLVRDRGVRFDCEIGEALIEGVDVLRGLMERAVAARGDAEPGAGALTLQRLQALFEARERAPEPEPAVEDEPASVDVVYFDSEAAPMGEDEGYLQIFLDFAGDALAQARHADDESHSETLRSVAEAAERLGLDPWRKAAWAYVMAIDADERGAALSALNRLYSEATGGPAPAPEAEIPAALDPPVRPQLHTDVRQAVAALAAAAREQGLDVVGDTAEATAAALDGAAFEDGLFDLHGNLRLWVDPDDARLSEAMATLDRWCLAQAEATLGRLALALTDEPRAVDWSAVERQTHRLGGVLTAAGASEAEALAARVGDLAARLATGEQEPDADAHRVLATFVAALRPILRAEPPAAEALAPVEAMLAGLFQPRAFDERIAGLDIPADFLGLLSPEAAETAREAARDGLQMHVVRVDSERRPELAAPFLAFLEGVRVISTRTVFAEDASLFDYLIACAFDPASLSRALCAIDPGGEGLKLIESRAPPEQGPASGASEPPGFVEMLETLGAVVTAQAGARRLAESLLERGHVDDAQTRQGELERLALLQIQIGDSLERLQQEVMASQLRPAAPLMETLCEIVRTRGFEAALAGADNRIDGQTLTALSQSAPGLVATALDGLTDAPGRSVELSLSQNEARVCLTLRVVGALARAPTVPADLASLRGEVAALESGEAGFRLTLPRAVALIDGMVMRVGAMRYFAPIQAVQRILRAQPSDRISVSAGGGDVLLLEAGALAPIRQLARAGETSATATSDLYVIVRDGGAVAALEIDEILGQEPLLVRPLAGYLSGIGAASGCAVMADGSIGVALDLERILSLAA